MGVLVSNKNNVLRESAKPAQYFDGKITNAGTICKGDFNDFSIKKIIAVGLFWPKPNLPDVVLPFSYLY